MLGLYNTDSSGLFGIGSGLGSLLGRRRRAEAKKRKEARAMSSAAGANNQIESRLSAVEGALEELNTAAAEPVVDTPMPQVSAGATNNLKALGTIEGVFGGPEERDITKAQVMAEPVPVPTVQESLQDQLGKTILGI